MPEDSKKQSKGKNDPKDQRKPRRSGQKQAHAESKPEKKIEKAKTDNIVAAPQKPVYETPGPEFYNSLKRETDDILKITEEENSKYKKKEIRSNWSKYEMPIESYEEIEEIENMGADYEKLIQAPLSVGGHFQFKHEKSWDLSIGPSLYDKYFDINMDNLSMALCTIPFYERNNLDQAIFSETDIETMNNRSTRFKQKYYNDKSYITPELEGQEKILNSLKDNLLKTEENTLDDDEQDKDIHIETKFNELVLGNTVKDLVESTIVDCIPSPSETLSNSEFKETDKKPITAKHDEINSELQDAILEFKIKNKTEEIEMAPSPIDTEFITDEFTEGISGNVSTEANTITNKLCNLDKIILEKEVKLPVHIQKDIVKTESAAVPKSQVAASPEVPKNPVIESPEDLEKWLDDFLDG